MGVLGEEIVEIDGLGVHVDLPGEEAVGLGEAADRIDIQSLDDGGLGGVGRGHKQPIAGEEGEDMQSSIQREGEDMQSSIDSAGGIV